MTPTVRLQDWLEHDRVFRTVTLGLCPEGVFLRLSYAPVPLPGGGFDHSQTGVGLTIEGAIEDALARAPE